MSQDAFLDLDDPPALSHPLREWTFAQMWNETWDVFRAQWRRWIALGLLALVPPLIGRLLLPIGPAFNQLAAILSSDGPSCAAQGPRSDDVLGALLLGLLVVVLGWGYTLIVANGAGAIMTSRVLTGQPASLRVALRTVFTWRARALIGANVLVGLALLTVMGSSMALTIYLIGLLGFVFLLYMAVAWLPLLNPLLALERGPLRRLLSRAWYFGRNRIWVIVAVLLCLAAVSFVAEAPVSLMRSRMLTDTVGQWPDCTRVLTDGYWAWQAVFTVMTLLEQSVVLPIGVILYTILYYDARARLDAPNSDVLIEAGDPARPLEAWLVKRDLINLMAFTGLVFVLLSVLYVSLEALTRIF